MKVSKPILIALILAILFAGYILIFTGKKRPAPLPSPGANMPSSGAQAAHPASTAEMQKPDIDAMNLSWRNDPFFLPRSVTDRKAEKPKAVPRLVAIMESKAGRYAIIGGEIVKKGDTVGDERVAEIGHDRVILIRNNVKRTLSIEDTVQ